MGPVTPISLQDGLVGDVFYSRGLRLPEGNRNLSGVGERESKNKNKKAREKEEKAFTESEPANKNNKTCEED